MVNIILFHSTTTTNVVPGDSTDLFIAKHSILIKISLEMAFHLNWNDFKPNSTYLDHKHTISVCCFKFLLVHFVSVCVWLWIYRYERLHPTWQFYIDINQWMGEYQVLSRRNEWKPLKKNNDPNARWARDPKCNDQNAMGTTPFYNLNPTPLKSLLIDPQHSLIE